jgi:hypothetical protein
VRSGFTPEEEAEWVASEEAKGLFEQPQPDARAEEGEDLLREEVADGMLTGFSNVARQAALLGGMGRAMAVILLALLRSKERKRL